MHHRQLIISFLMLTATVLTAKASEDDTAFRQRLNAIVNEGNRQSLRSSRQGIALWADSLDRALRQRSREHRLTEADSLDYTADLLKLRADWHYENATRDTASFDRAERLYRQALAIYEAHPFFAANLKCAPVIHRSLAQLHYARGRYAEALGDISAALAAYDTAADNGEFLPGDAQHDTWLDLQAQAAIVHARLGHAQEARQRITTLIATMRSLRARRQLSEATWRETLRKQGKIEMLIGGKGCERRAATHYRDYMDWRRSDALATLATLTAEEREDYWMRTRPFLADCYQTTTADPSLLYDATLLAKGLLLQLSRLAGQGRASAEALRSLAWRWTDIQRRLPADGCAIEFVQYERGGAQRLGALVLGRTGRPQWVDMATPEELLAHAQYSRTVAERLYSTSGTVKNALYRDTAYFATLWPEALVRAIGSAQRIYFAPDGPLHQLAIEYMLPPALDGRDVYRLTSTRRLMERNTTDTRRALVVGGVAYDQAAPAPAASTQPTAPTASTANTSSGTRAALPANDSRAYACLHDRRLMFSYLPWSLAEADSIIAVRRCPADTLLTGSRATEAAFRSLCGRYGIVDVSTHGYFGAAETPQGTDLKPCLTDESLSESVILLGGSMAALADDSFDPTLADGIVSARELAGTDMSGVGLFVVSACQTGLGFVTADGVYGLQRGLKNAGVQSIMVSLWSVDDQATSLLMTRFHAALASGLKPHRALMAARESLLRSADAGATSPSSHSFTTPTPVRTFDAAALTQRTRHAADYSDPQYANAFIIIDAIEE